MTDGRKAIYCIILFLGDFAAIIANKPDLHVVEIIKPGQAKYTDPCTCAYCEHKDTNPTVPSAPQSSNQSVVFFYYPS